MNRTPPAPADTGDPLGEPAAGSKAPSLVVNALGFLEDPYVSAEPTALDVRVSTLEAARSGGLVAANITVSLSDDADEARRAIADHDRLVARHPNLLIKVLSIADLEHARQQGRIGLIFGFQNAAMVEDDLDNVDRFADAGVRIVQLTYNSRNQLGGGALDPDDSGLTSFGRRVVDRLVEHRVAVDLSHSGERLCRETTDLLGSDHPGCITHTGCRAIADVPRNKSDAELRAVAAAGGFVGIYAMPYLAPGRRFDSRDVIAHLEHAIDVCGQEAVGIGTDHGVARLQEPEERARGYAASIARRRTLGISAPGENPSLPPYAEDLTGPGQFQDLAQALRRRGWRGTAIDDVLGTNFVRFLARVWGA